ncbi:MAG: NUDIX hydrolase [Vulcanimicrobiaceae bacterium]
MPKRVVASDPRPAPSSISVAVDAVLLAPGEDALSTVLLQRREPPFEGDWTLPGVLVGGAETLEAAAARALETKAGLEGAYLEQLCTFGAPGRDPRSRTLSVAYVALVPHARIAAARGDVVVARLEVPWPGEQGGPVHAYRDGERLALGFDHAEVLGVAVKRIRGKLEYTPIGFELLPPAFTLGDLQRVHETVLGRTLNKDSFRRRMLASGDLESTGEQRTGVEHRPAMLYRRRKETTNGKVCERPHEIIPRAVLVMRRARVRAGK